jgi:ornithine cyclodeaminase/alanine dehydrogenase-like protein (mu-crystallin family)
MLHLTEDDVRSVLTIRECIDALSIAYDDLGKGDAVSLPHIDIHAATDADDAIETVDDSPVGYRLKTQTGVVGSMNAGMIRFNSLLMQWPTVDGQSRSVKLPATADGSFVGLCLLFDSTTGKLQAILPDGHLGQNRVAATNVLVAERVADPNPEIVGILGAGAQATAHVLAIDELERPSEIQVYSPSSAPEFVEQMSEQIDTPIVAVDSAQAACTGADRVYSTTNQLDPVIDWSMIEPGTHVSCVLPAEIDVSVFERASRLIFHSLEQLGPQHWTVGEEMESVPELTMDWHPQAAQIDLDDLPVEDVADAMAGEREHTDGVTVFLNNVGLGIQFAAIGKRVYELARDAGLGETMADETFMQQTR